MIGKTRQGVVADPDKLLPELWAARGVLNTPPPQPLFQIERHAPSKELSDTIENYWSVCWEFGVDQIHIQETLPHPNIHVVFEDGGANAFGVVSGKFTRRLEGKSRVFGARFAPGMFRGFFGKPVSSLTDTSIPIRNIFGEDARDLEAAIESAATDSERVSLANRFLVALLPPTDSKAQLAHALVLRARECRDLLRVEHLADAFNLNPRTLQRLFADYVGISPKWVIRRYRLQEAVTCLRSDAELDCASLALTLGYFDQAHLINDFRSILGYTPAQFQKELKAPR